MVKNFLYFAAAVFFLASCSPEQSKKTAQNASKQQIENLSQTTIPTAKNGTLLIADFNSGKKPNKLGGDFGSWDRDPNDYTQTATDGFISAIKHGEEGFSLQIYYDVNSPNPAFNGFWMKLNNLNASNYTTLNLWIKGDKLRGFTRIIKTELKNSKGEIGTFYIDNISDKWQEIIIPLKSFKGLNDLTSLSEFTIVFEDTSATKKEGAIYIDDIYLK